MRTPERMDGRNNYQNFVFKFKTLNSKITFSDVILSVQYFNDCMGDETE
jgi:hypothetical protein